MNLFVDPPTLRSKVTACVTVLSLIAFHAWDSFPHSVLWMFWGGCGRGLRHPSYGVDPPPLRCLPENPPTLRSRVTACVTVLSLTAFHGWDSFSLSVLWMFWGGCGRGLRHRVSTVTPPVTPLPLPPPRHGGLWGTVSAVFLHPGLRDTKKGGSGRASKTRPDFLRFWGLPGGPQEGSLSGDSSILTFAAGPQKGSNMGAKMERFGHPNPSYTNFGPPFVRNRCPKSCIEKRLQNLGSKRTTLGGQKSPKTDIWGTLGSVGVQMEARTPKITKMISKMTPGTPTFNTKQ